MLFVQLLLDIVVFAGVYYRYVELIQSKPWDYYESHKKGAAT